MYLVEGNSVIAGQQCLVQVRLSESIVAGPGDRFILRTLSPPQTVGGGMIVEAIPEKLKRNRPEILEDAQARAKAVLNQKDFVEYCIKTAEAFAVSETELSRRAKIRPARIKEILAKLVSERKVQDVDSKLYIHSKTIVNVEQQLLKIVGEFHNSRPESPGMSVEQLYEASQLRKDVFDGLIRLVISQGKLIETKHRVALPEHRETFSEDERRLLASVESLFRSKPFSPPQCQELIEATSALQEQVEKILKILIEQERLVRVENDLLFHIDAIEKARQVLVDFIEKEGKLESVKFKYLLETTRKFAIPLLDYFDRIGVTRRIGNTRYLKTPNKLGG